MITDAYATVAVERTVKQQSDDGGRTERRPERSRFDHRRPRCKFSKSSRGAQQHDRFIIERDWQRQFHVGWPR